MPKNVVPSIHGAERPSPRSVSLEWNVQMKRTPLDRKWEQLMSLCECESKYRAQAGYARLKQLVASEITELAGAMGFSPRRIATRDFRAERDGDHIIRILTD